MRKKAVIFIGILLYLGILGICLGNICSQISQPLASVTLANEEAVILAGNCGRDVVLMEVSREGELLNTCLGSGFEGKVYGIGQGKETYVLLREMDGKQQKLTLCMLTGWKSLEETGTLALENTFQMTDFMVGEDEVSISGIDQEKGRAVAYVQKEQGTGFEKRQLSDASLTVYRMKKGWEQKQGIDLLLYGAARLYGSRWLVFSICYLLVWLLAWALVKKTRKRGSLFCRTAAGITAAGLLLGAGFLIWSRETGQKELLAARLEQTTLYGYMQKTAYTGENTLSDWVAESARGYPIRYQTSLVALKDDIVKVVQSESMPVGTQLQEVYGTHALDYVLESKETGYSVRGTVIQNGEACGAAVVPVQGAGEGQYLFLTSSLEDIPKVIEQQMISLVTKGIGIWLLCLLLPIVWLYHSLRPITLIGRSLENITGGSFELPQCPMPGKQLESIWKNIHKIANSMKLQSYSSKHVLDYYYRFSPRRFEQLFEKERLQDVPTGEGALIPGTGEIISIAAKEQYCTKEGQGRYTARMNLLLNIIGSRKSRGGIPIPGQSSLGAVKLIYKESPESTEHAIKLGIECIGRLEEADEGAGLVKPISLIHTGEFLCGLVGNQEVAYPYISSLELELLENHTHDLQELGVRMVITSSGRERQNSYTDRYIGYLERGESKFRLYEIMEACPPTQRQLKKQALPQFEKGMELFYQKDFYLARNYFSQALKICPQDGVARWYVFTCERLFNLENQEDIRYGLFG